MKPHRNDDGVPGSGGTARLGRTLLYLATRTFRIPRAVAMGIVRSAMASFDEVRGRYPRPEAHLPVLIGIFRSRCREHLEVGVRAGRRPGASRTTARASGSDTASARTEPAMDGAVLSETARQDEVRRVLVALADVRRQPREMLRLITVEKRSRRELAKRFGSHERAPGSGIAPDRQELQKFPAATPYTVASDW